MKAFWDLKLHGVRSRQRYLNNTDWMITRFSECSTPVDQIILDKRALAREEISLIKSTTNDPLAVPETIAADYELIKHLTKEF